MAQTAVGFTPADLENLLNEAALLSARDDKREIDMEAIRKAFIKVSIGTEKRSRVVTEKDRKMTAYHEAGHAICREVLPDIDSTYIVSIIPTGRAGGYVMSHPSQDQSYMRKKHMEQEIVSLLGGFAAESLIFNDITTGSSSDIKHATGLARNMVVKYGMSDTMGPINFGSENEEVFLGRDFAHTRNYGEQVADQIDMEIKRIVENAHNEALRILETHMDILHKLSEMLLEKERVSGKEVRAMFPYGVLVEKEHQKGLLGD